MISRELQWKTFKRRLYGDSDGPPVRTGSLNAVVPSGVVALWNLMTSSHSDLVGPSPFDSDELGDPIGPGTFATICTAKDSNERVIKLSRYGVKAALDRESSV